MWDTYKEGSLKETTRETRGQGIRRRVIPQAKLPKDFSSFLRDPNNKEEFFELLSEDINTVELPPEKIVRITKGQSVITKGPVGPMPNSDQEEADTRMCLHIADAAKHGARKIMVSTVDTDVIVILIGIFFRLSALYPDLQIWVAFGKGKSFRYYNISSICSKLGEQTSRALPFFHSLTGSDTTSQFLGKAKRSCWEAWKHLPQTTTAFLYPFQHPFQPMSISSPNFQIIQNFVCILYDSASSTREVNKLRMELFPRKISMMQKLPPTEAALIQHVNRSIYQANIWLKCLDAEQHLPSPEAFGWLKIGSMWKPLWTTLPEVEKTCRQLIKCGCKAEPKCSKKCACKNTGLRCTELCLCRGLC